MAFVSVKVAPIQFELVVAIPADFLRTDHFVRELRWK
jgi:hypothetical protein